MFPRGYFSIYFTPGYFGLVPEPFGPPTAEDAGTGTGVEFEGSDYPFVKPSANVRYLLADVWISHYVVAAVGPLHISNMYNFNRIYEGTYYVPGQNLVDLIIKDANNLTIINTTTALSYRGTPFGSRFFIHEWIFSDRICRVIQHKRLSDKYQTDTVPSNLVPTNGVLDERTNDLMPARVLEFIVGSEVLSGDVVFQAGWNMEIIRNPVSGHGTSIIDTSALFPNTTENVIAENTLEFEAVAGAGAGQYPGCLPNDEIGLRRINNVPPTQQGDFRLDGQGCILVAPPYVIGDPTHIIPSALEISNQCGPCRPCANYVDAYRELRDVHANLASISSRAQHDRDRYRDMVTQVNEVADNCVKSITGSVLGGADFTATTVGVSVQVTNNTAACYTNVTLNLSMTFPTILSPYIASAGGFKVEENGIAVPWHGGGFPSVSETFARIAPGASVRLHFVIIWMVSPPASPPVGTFTLTATATCDQGSIPVGSTAETLSISEAIT